VRLFDVRKPQSVISQVNVGGGAWRVKWHPLEERRNDLLVACMHDGFKIVQFDFGGQRDSESMANIEGRRVKHFDKHQSLAYGADWSFATSDGRDTLIGSCSFYDHALYVWSG
jgi:diphthamide biosynthesis protein 7